MKSESFSKLFLGFCGYAAAAGVIMFVLYCISPELAAFVMFLLKVFLTLLMWGVIITTVVCLIFFRKHFTISQPNSRRDK